MTDIHRFVTADEAREAALAWHYDDSQQFWSDLAEAYALFEQGAFDFPELAEEFAENGIISRQASFLARYNRWTAAVGLLMDALLADAYRRYRLGRGITREEWQALDAAGLINGGAVRRRRIDVGGEMVRYGFSVVQG